VQVCCCRGPVSSPSAGGNESPPAAPEAGFSCGVGVVSWSLRFSEPIVLDDGSKLATLGEAISHLGKIIPKAEHDMPKILTAAELFDEGGRTGRLGRIRAHRCAAGDQSPRRAGVQSIAQRPTLGTTEVEERHAMKLTRKFAEMTPEKRPQDPSMDGTGLSTTRPHSSSRNCLPACGAGGAA
jgi:hypothetical protein